MKKIIISTLCFILFSMSFLNIKTLNNKQDLLFTLDSYSLLIRKDLLEKGEVTTITKLLLDKDKVKYVIEEQKENENIKFSLTSVYFNYFKNRDLEISINYFVMSW